jgi:aminoglycoside 6-adenylyltransferase
VSTTPRIESFLAAVTDWARAEPGVRAAVLIGSYARVDTPADEWSDVDVLLVVDEPAPLAADLTWVAKFGDPEVTFVETATVGGQPERRVLFSDGLEVDFPLFPVELWRRMLDTPDAIVVFARGHRVLYDDLGAAAAIAALPQTVELPRSDPAELVQAFWYQALWSAKKLRRGEAIMARRSVEGRLKGMLLELARELASSDTWHEARFVERWADPRVLDAFWSSAASPAELGLVLLRLCDVFDAVASDLGLSHPAATAARARLVGLLA